MTIIGVQISPTLDLPYCMEGERSVRLETLIKKVDWILVFETSVVKLIDWPETKGMFLS